MVDCQTDNHSRVVKGPEGEKPPKHDTNMKKKERDRTGTYTKFDGDDECLNCAGFVVACLETSAPPALVPASSALTLLDFAISLFIFLSSF